MIFNSSLRKLSVLPNSLVDCTIIQVIPFKLKIVALTLRLSIFKLPNIFSLQSYINPFLIWCKFSFAFLNKTSFIKVIFVNKDTRILTHQTAITAFFKELERCAVILVNLEKLMFFFFYKWNKLFVKNHFNDWKWYRNWLIVQVSFFMVAINMFEIHLIKIDLCFFGWRLINVLRWWLVWCFLISDEVIGLVDWIGIERWYLSLIF